MPLKNIIQSLRSRIKKREGDSYISVDATTSCTETIQNSPSPKGSRKESENATPRLRIKKKSKSFHYANQASPSVAFVASFDDKGNIINENPTASSLKRSRTFTNPPRSADSSDESSLTNFSLSDYNKMASTEELSKVKVALPTTIDAVRARRIERALKARIRMLYQHGPNSFVTQSESGKKYRVIIGPQTCNCNHGHFCIHLLFVMLRVLNVSSRDPILWSRNLKNFEVDQLIKSYEEKAADPRKQLTPRSSESSLRSLVGDINSSADTPTSGASSVFIEDDEACPICLQEMEQSQDLVMCKAGCKNRLHRICMETWAEEQQKLKKRLMCPLCRVQWSDITSYAYLGNQAAPQLLLNNEVIQGPFNDPWLHPLIAIPNIELIKEKRSIPPQFRSKSRSWVQVFGVDFVKCVFSKEWTIRETAFRWLGQLVIRLLRENKASVELYGNNIKLTTLQECLATLLSYAIMDPVHKVYIAALAVTQGVTLFSAPETKSYLSFIFQPVLEAIFIRCTDPTRRTYLNSSDYLLYLCRYNENSKTFGGIDYLFSFSLNTHNSTDDWKWWLGRLRVLLRLLTETPLFFTLPEKHDANARGVGSRFTMYAPGASESTSMHRRLFKVIDFAIQGMSISHFGVRKTGSRVLRESIRRASKDPDALMEIKTLLSSLGRNSNPMLSIYASVLREEALRRQKQKPEGRDGALTAKMSIPLSKPAVPQIEIDSCAAGSSQSQYKQQFSGDSYSRSESLLSSSYSRSSSVSFAGDSSPPSSSHVNSPTEHDTPRSLIIESDFFKFDQVPTSMSTPSSNAPTPETAKRVGPETDNNMIPLPRKLSKPVPSFENITEDPEFQPAATAEFEECCGGDVPASILRRTSVATDNATCRGKRKMKGPRPRSLPPMDNLLIPDDGSSLGTHHQQIQFQMGGGAASTCGIPLPLNPSPSPSEKRGESSASSSSSGKGNLRADEDYELAMARAKNLSLRENPLPHIEAFQNTNDVILHSPNGTNGAYVEGVHWKRGKLIGTGGCSTCYTAWDVNQGQLMVVKQVSFIRNTEYEQAEVIESVREEIGLMRQISHRNIVRLIGAIQLDGHFNIFVEWMSGGSVSDLLDKFGAFNEKIILNYTQQVILAIDYLHTNRFLHRDLKGANCFVDSGGRNLRVGDFGTSAKINATLTPAGQFRGQLLGTVAFMAPEVLRGEDYGRPCDIWSIGCCILEMAEAKPPWNARALTNSLALIFKIASTSMAPPIPDHLSPATRDLTMRCLEADPAHRPPASELLTHAVFTRLPNLSLDAL